MSAIRFLILALGLVLAVLEGGCTSAAPDQPKTTVADRPVPDKVRHKHCPKPVASPPAADLVATPTAGPDHRQPPPPRRSVSSAGHGGASVHRQ
jgi:hypothetical protein